MTTEIECNSDNDEPAYQSFRVTISDDILVEAIEKHYRDTGIDNREIAREAIISYLESEDYIRVE